VTAEGSASAEGAGVTSFLLGLPRSRVVDAATNQQTNETALR
jgi:hypothetical protein